MINLYIVCWGITHNAFCHWTTVYLALQIFSSWKSSIISKNILHNKTRCPDKVFNCFPQRIWVKQQQLLGTSEGVNWRDLLNQLRPLQSAFFNCDIKESCCSVSVAFCSLSVQWTGLISHFLPEDHKVFIYHLMLALPLSSTDMCLYLFL